MFGSTCPERNCDGERFAPRQPFGSASPLCNAHHKKLANQDQTGLWPSTTPMSPETRQWFKNDPVGSPFTGSSSGPCNKIVSPHDKSSAKTKGVHVLRVAGEHPLDRERWIPPPREHQLKRGVTLRERVSAHFGRGTSSCLKLTSVDMTISLAPKKAGCSDSPGTDCLGHDGA